METSKRHFVYLMANCFSNSNRSKILNMLIEHLKYSFVCDIHANESVIRSYVLLKNMTTLVLQVRLWKRLRPKINDSVCIVA